MKCNNCGKTIENGNICDACKKNINGMIDKIKDEQKLQNKKYRKIFSSESLNYISKFFLFITIDLLPIHAFIFLLSGISMAESGNGQFENNIYFLIWNILVSFGIYFRYLSDESKNKLLFFLPINFFFIIMHIKELLSLI